MRTSDATHRQGVEGPNEDRAEQLYDPELYEELEYLSELRSMKSYQHRLSDAQWQEFSELQ